MYTFIQAACGVCFQSVVISEKNSKACTPKQYCVCVHLFLHVYCCGPSASPCRSQHITFPLHSHFTNKDGAFLDANEDIFVGMESHIRQQSTLHKHSNVIYFH